MMERARQFTYTLQQEEPRKESKLKCGSCIKDQGMYLCPSVQLSRRCTKRRPQVEMQKSGWRERVGFDSTLSCHGGAVPAYTYSRIGDETSKINNLTGF
jgi:hypothetical protein